MEKEQTEKESIPLKPSRLHRKSQNVDDKSITVKAPFKLKICVNPCNLWRPLSWFQPNPLIPSPFV